MEAARNLSPDGRILLISRVDPKTRSDVFMVRLDSGTEEPLLITAFDESQPEFSPDGRWIAYVSDQTDRPEIWIRPFPGPGASLRVSADGGREPRWSADGKEIFFQELQAGGPKLMAAPVSMTASEVRIGAPRVIVSSGFIGWAPNSSRTYDVSRHGRFLMLQDAAEGADASPYLAVVLNWFEELKRLVPAN